MSFRTVRASGRAGASGLHAEYVLHTTVDPTLVTGLVLDFDIEWIGTDSSADPLVVSVWKAGTWVDITTDALGGMFVALAPQAYIDPEGNIRILLEDTAATKKEKKETAVVDLLVATLHAGPADPTPPAAPTGLLALAGDSQVTLGWDDNQEWDLDGYFVYRHAEPDGPLVQLNAVPVTESSYIDASAENGTTYTYHVTAVDQGGHESGPSATADATPGALPTMWVGDIDMTAARAGKNWKATAVVLITDLTPPPVAGATVVGDWLLDGGSIETGASGITDATGHVTLVSPPRKIKAGTFTFTVTGVVHNAHAYDWTANVETSDSVSVP
ncbi:MAG: fibronectin type III domain-containing protein [Candidatus Brocadiae bacterium]|nr:fibronectin type III domain-containing protein [Candidatus Brocadiia bacterium]